MIVETDQEKALRLQAHRSHQHVANRRTREAIRSLVTKGKPPVEGVNSRAAQRRLRQLQRQAAKNNPLKGIPIAAASAVMPDPGSNPGQGANT